MIRPAWHVQILDGNGSVSTINYPEPTHLITVMHKSTDPKFSAAPSQQCTGIGWHYPLLLAMQTLGVLTLYRNGLPWYRDLLADPSVYEPRKDTWIWALSAIALLQVGYWVCYRVRPPLPRITNVILGHVVLFISRLSFLLATTVFSFVFFAQKLASKMPPSRYVLMIVGLFSLFCYMQELQRFGKCLLGQEGRSDVHVP
jgi:hypothetical protein